jgi:hypothetical protein
VADTPEPETLRPPVYLGIEKVSTGKSYSTRVTGRWQDPHQYWAEFNGLEFRVVQPTLQVAGKLAAEWEDDLRGTLIELRDEGLASGDPVDDLVAASARMALQRLVGRMEDLALEDELFYRLAKLPYVLLTRGGQLATALAHHAQVWPTRIAHRFVGGGLVASELRDAISTLPKGNRYWVHTEVKEAKSDKDGKVTSDAVRAVFTVVKHRLGFGRHDWVCLELLAYLQKYAFLRPRSTALLAMLHSRSIIWCRENRIPDTEFVKFQASTIGLAMRIDKAASILQEELCGKEVAAAVVSTMAGEDFDDEVDAAVIRGYLLSPFWWMVPIYQSLSREKRKLWVSRSIEGRGWSGGVLAARLLDGIVPVYLGALKKVPFADNRLMRLPASLMKLSRVMFFTPSWSLPVTKSKEYFT